MTDPTNDDDASAFAARIMDTIGPTEARGGKLVPLEACATANDDRCPWQARGHPPGGFFAAASFCAFSLARSRDA